MILDSTVRKLQVVLGEAHTTNPCAVVASWFDSGSTPSGGPSLSNTNGTTAVDIVAAPASGYIRQVNELSVFNADTVTHSVTVRYNDNGTTYTLMKATLAPGYTLTYSKSLSWAVMSPTGLFIAGQIPGTSTNDSAAAGMVGEYISQTLSFSVPVSLVSATPKDVVSISLTPGDWDVYGNLGQTPAAGTTITQIIGWISSVSATQPSAPNEGSFLFDPDTHAAGSAPIANLGRIRISLASTTTIYASISVTFSGGTNGAFGFIGARRVR